MNRQAIIDVFNSRGFVAPLVIYYNIIDKPIPCIFLYEGENKVGHWCAILKHPNSWEIFDPVGLYPDSEIDIPHMQKVQKKFQRIFGDINMNYGTHIQYNDFSHQKGGKSCGLWCILRWLQSDLNIDEFNAEYQNFTDWDVCRYFGRPDLYK